MQLLESNILILRALEMDDVEFLFHTENNTGFWEVSNTITPYSKHILKKYIENSYQDIYEAKQLRLVIENKKNKESIGLIDLFDFNPQHNRVGVGILILKEFQNKGYAKEALKILINYVFNILNIHQIFVNIPSKNKASMHLFEKLSFLKIGIKKDWIIIKGNYTDVYMYQLVNTK